VKLVRYNFFWAVLDRIRDLSIFDKICGGFPIFPAIRSLNGVLSGERDISVIELVPFVVLE